MTAHQRKDIQLKGILNFRDAGGFVLPDRRQIRKGLLYRSGQFEKASKADIDMVLKLGIKTLIDLRPEKEWLKMPDELKNLRQVHLETDITRETMQRLQPYLNKRNVQKEIVEVMESIYGDLVNWIAPHLKPLFTELAHEENYPIVIHCRGGKDRTGVVIATIQSLLGLDRQSILAHYSETNNYLLPQAIKAFKKFKWFSFGLFPSGNYLAAYTAKEHFLEAFFKEMGERYGDTRSYLLANNVSAEDIVKVEKLLTEPMISG